MRLRRRRCDDVEVVDFEDALDLGEEALEEAEVATGDPFHGGEGLSVGEIVEVKNFAQFSPVAFENELEFVVPQGSVLVGEAEATVELGVAAKLFLDPGHADEDDGDVGAVVAVTEKFEGCRGEPFGFVDDDEFNEMSPGSAPGVVEDLTASVEVFFDAPFRSNDDAVEVFVEDSRRRRHVRCVEHRAGAIRSGGDLGFVVASRAPGVEKVLDRVPVRVPAGGECLANPGRSEADSDGVLLFDGVGELGEAAVFLGDDERAGHGVSSS